MTFILKYEKGFTLVELMVVVAILAILSTIAVPNFRKFQAKAKTSEAKLHLSSIYSSQIAFRGNADIYATCLADMGYDPSRQTDSRYYSTGFHNSQNSNTFVNKVVNHVNNVPCISDWADNNSFFIAGKHAGKAANIVDDAEIESSFIGSEGATFSVAAQGAISPSKLKELAHDNPFKKFLDAIVSEAYASDGGADRNTDAPECALPGKNTSGTSLFTINEEKTISAVCNGY